MSITNSWMVRNCYENRFALKRLLLGIKQLLENTCVQRMIKLFAFVDLNKVHWLLKTGIASH